MFSSNILIFLAYLLVFFSISQSNGDLYYNENCSKMGHQKIPSMNAIKENLKQLNLYLYTLENRLHLQSDLINSIRTEVTKVDMSPEYCNTVAMFNGFETILRKTQQNLMNLLNRNDEQHLDKLNTILLNVKTIKDCLANDSQNVTEIQIEMLKNTKIIQQLIERLENFESKLEITLKPKEERSKTLNNIVQQIHLKLSLQEDVLLKFNQHINEFQNKTASDDNKISRCHKGNGLIYQLYEANKNINLEKPKKS